MEAENRESLRILNEEEINLDLRRNFADYRIKLEDLMKIKYPPSPSSKEDALRNYSLGYNLREFTENKGIRVSYSAGEVMPVVFTPIIIVKDLYEVIDYGRAKGLEDLEDMKIIEIGIFGPPTASMRTLIKVNDFETIRNGIVSYASNQKQTNKKELCESFNIELGSLKNDIDRISNSTTSIFEEFNEWYKDKRGNPRNLLMKFMKEKKEEPRTAVGLNYEPEVTVK